MKTTQHHRSLTRFALGLCMAVSFAGCTLDGAPGSASDETSARASELGAVTAAEHCTGSEFHPYPGLLSTCERDSSNATSARNFASSFCRNKGGVLSSGFACSFGSRTNVTLFATCNALCGGQ